MYSLQPNQKYDTGNINQANARGGVFYADNRPISTSPLALPRQNAGVQVIQLSKTPRKPRKKYDYFAKKRKKKRLYEAKPWREPDNELAGRIIDAIVKTKAYILKVKAQLDDDDDRLFIDDLMKDLKLKKSRYKELNEMLKDTPMKRFRSQNIGRITLKHDLMDLMRQVNHLSNTVKHFFPMHSGGFGAKGRAHEMNVEVGSNTSKSAEIDNEFVSNFSFNGVTIQDNIYKAPKKIIDGASKAIVEGKAVKRPADRAEQLANLEPKLEIVNKNQPGSFTGTPPAKDRGAGQYANMANTNASGYAYLINVPGWETQKWEWLHIRGAGLGGKTDSTNLVVGTRDANTHMIPFESNIRTLGTMIGKEEIPYKSLNVTWSASTQFTEDARHAFHNISSNWELIPKSSWVSPIVGEANFSPLTTHNNISKKEVDLIENALKTVREDIKE